MGSQSSSPVRGELEPQATVALSTASVSVAPRTGRPPRSAVRGSGALAPPPAISPTLGRPQQPTGGRTGAVTRRLSPGVTLLVLDVSLAPGRRVPRSVDHVFSLSLDPDIPEIDHVVRIGATEVVGDNPVVIGRPLPGQRWVDANGCC